MDFKDYYATLGVSKTASDKDIKRSEEHTSELQSH